MHIERVTLTNFRCFGGDPTTIDLDGTFAAFVGANATGKTAAFAALGRMFGISRADRQITPDDFHVPFDETDPPESRTLSIETIVAFPELTPIQDETYTDHDTPTGDGDDPKASSVPEFFRQMAATESGELKCRFRLDATWTDDGSVDGTVTETLQAIRTFADAYGDEECSRLRPMDRSRIQVVYVPASRDGARHLTSFLKSRLWKAGQWSDDLRTALNAAASEIGDQFRAEPVVAVIEKSIDSRWQHLHRGPFEATPTFRPIERDLTQLVNKTQLLFSPGAAGNDQRADQLSDGQRSLLQIALTAATIDIETAIAAGVHTDEFDADSVQLPSLTLLLVEEPENSLAPHYLSRIISQMLDIGRGRRAQAFVSSQSASVLRRVEPSAVRHFRLDPATRTSIVNALTLPDDSNDAAVYIREAVQAYPELYFARFVVLGEGSSEEVVIPALADAAGTIIDQSFVAVVPLGGRHVNHMWRLLNGLAIPHATLLDLDLGRDGGGVGRLRTTCQELERLGRAPLNTLAGYTTSADLQDSMDHADIEAICRALEAHHVVFSAPLDLDMSMLAAFPDAYQQVEDGRRGPGDTNAFDAVLGAHGDPDQYEGWDARMRWYRYLFLGRSKPTTHLQALKRIESDDLRDGMPAELRTLISFIAAAVDT